MFTVSSSLTSVLGDSANITQNTCRNAEKEFVSSARQYLLHESFTVGIELHDLITAKHCNEMCFLSTLHSNVPKYCIYWQRKCNPQNT